MVYAKETKHPTTGRRDVNGETIRGAFAKHRMTPGTHRALEHVASWTFPGWAAGMLRTVNIWITPGKLAHRNK